MQANPIVLGKQSLRSSFITALKSCEQRKKLQPGYINYDQIKFLRDFPARTEAEEAKSFDLEARQIMRALHEAQRAVIVDADSLEKGLAIINQYKGCWKITDEIIEKLYVVAYDPEMPDKAEIVRDIKKALEMLARFHRQSKVVFITVNGHAFNFAMDLAKSKNEIDFDLPEFSKIVEVSPEEAWSLIASNVINGKTAFVHEALLRRNPAIALMSKTLNEEQRDRVNVVIARKKF